jgi:cytidine deaminase
MTAAQLDPALKQTLAERARQAREWAYAPYSRYRVGAAILAASGKIYEGVNVENAAYPLTMCAERNALFRAVGEGEREFTAIAVVTGNGGTPCGACRQALSEFGRDTLVIIAGPDGQILEEHTIAELLPGAFGPGHLA